MKIAKKVPPFGRSLSFKKLFEYSQNNTPQDEHTLSYKIFSLIRGYIEQNPELLEKITDKSILEKHSEFIHLMMNKFFQITPQTDMIGAVSAPFADEPFFKTQNFDCLSNESLSFAQDLTQHNIDIDRLYLMHGYSFIFKKYFDIEYSVDLPMVKYLRDDKTGLLTCYKMNIDTSFADVELVDQSFDFKKISANELMENLTNGKKIMELLPPEKFEFSGIVVMSATDVTDSEILSIIKHELIENSFLKEKEKFLKVQDLIRSYFKVSGLELGIAGMFDKQILILNSGFHASNECIYRDSQHFCMDDFKGSLFEKAVKSNEDVVITDLKKISKPGNIESRMLEKGARNVIISPLSYNNTTIGAIYLVSQNPCDMCGTDMYKLNEIKPLFSLSLKRSIEEFNNNIQIIIQNKFTSIHPSVEWRFRESAIKYIDDMAVQPDPPIDPIIFQSVYPLFGVSDIRGSSSHRNSAIRDDILVHLDTIRKILQSAYNTQELPILDEMIYRTDENIEKARENLSSGDEIEIINFISREIEPSLDHLKLYGTETEKLISEYYSMKDNEHNTVYSKRKAFDDSVMKINQVVSSYLDSTQKEAQKIFPHYFEKQSTDGVDFSIYIGESMSNEKPYDEIYLKNLRLWQIIVLCNIANISEELKKKTPVALDTTHLLVVQDMPITVAFDFEEKGFRVEGAYNIRYEIIKKRIDKAVISDTGERLTQPRKLAMVYSQQKERNEYIQYLDYLIFRGYLEGEIEQLDLEDLQGVRGLKALRCDIAVRNDLINQPIRHIIDSAFS